MKVVFFREKLNMDLKKLSTNLEKTKWLSRFFFLDRITKRGIYIFFKIEIKELFLLKNIVKI